MNFFSLGDVSVVMDLAHNEAGLDAMIEIMNGVRRPGARLLLGLGAVGDRQDDLLERLGEIAGMQSDVVAIGHKLKYLRGRSQDEMDHLLRAGLERVGMTDVASYDTEVESLAALVAQARPGDVVGLMCHAERQQAYDWIAAHGGTADDPETLAAKVRARGRLTGGRKFDSISTGSGVEWPRGGWGSDDGSAPLRARRGGGVARGPARPAAPQGRGVPGLRRHLRLHGAGQAADAAGHGGLRGAQ